MESIIYRVWLSRGGNETTVENNRHVYLNLLFFKGENPYFCYFHNAPIAIHCARCVALPLTSPISARRQAVMPCALKTSHPSLPTDFLIFS
jgi:hypothetical protein